MTEIRERRGPASLSSGFGGGWLLLPTAAALAGVWAAAPQAFGEMPERLAFMVALILGGWQPLWSRVGRTDFATPLHQWTGWTREIPLERWPYLQPGTPGARLHQRLARARAWWREVGRPALETPLWQALEAALVSLALGWGLGREPLLLTLCFLAWTELATLWREGKGEPGPLWHAAAMVGFPWLLGATVVMGDLAQSAVPALVATAMVGCFSCENLFSLIAPLIGAGYLAWHQRAVLAGWLVLLAVPGWVVWAHRPPRSFYRRMVGPWVVMMVLLLAWGL